MAHLLSGKALDDGHRQSSELEAAANCRLLFVLGGRCKSRGLSGIDFHCGMVGGAEGNSTTDSAAEVVLVVLAIDPGRDDILRRGCFDADELRFRPR